MYSRELELRQHLTISEGMTHNGVTSILEDSNGYLWIGTFDGLNRYDGYSFMTIKNSFHEKILSNNRVRCLTEDQKGNIWIGCENGITLYDYEKETFDNTIFSTTFDLFQHEVVVREIFIHEKYGTIVGTQNQGLFLFKVDTEPGKRIRPVNSTRQPVIFDGIRLDNTRYLFLSVNGVLEYNSETEILRYVLGGFYKRNSKILKLKGKDILVSKNKGLSVISIEETEEGSYSYDLRSNYFKDTEFHTINLDDSGNLWLGTSDSELIHIENVNAFINNEKYGRSSFFLKSKTVNYSTITFSRFGICWVGTFDKGLLRFNIDENTFHNITSENKESRYGLRSEHIMGVFPVGNDEVFLKANKRKLALYNTSTHEFVPMPNRIDKVKSRVLSLYEDQCDNLWLKRFDYPGYHKLKKNTNSLYYNQDDSITLYKGTQFAQDKYKNIWIGGMDNLIRVQKDSVTGLEKIESISEHPLFLKKHLYFINRIYADPLYNFIWVGTRYDGLVRIDISSNKGLAELPVQNFKPEKGDLNSIPGLYISDIVRLPNNELWISTEYGGICKVDNSNQKPLFTNYTEKDGLSNNVVKALQYDKNNNLWIATNNGLNLFDVKNKEFRVFSTSDGLPFADFGYGRALLPNGYLLFSGNSGLCYFNPEQVDIKEMLPKLQFNKFKLFNTNIAPGDTINNRVLLTRRINDTKKIELEYNENTFSLNAKPIHYSSHSNHHIQYRLLPVNSTWIEAPSDQGNIHYNNLNPGQYILQVKASNSLNKWTNIKELHISIKKPYWRTTFAYLMYLFVFLFAVFLLVHFFLRLKSLKHLVQIEQIEKDKQKELAESKLRYFSNISHEIKTPLTLISGPVQFLLERFAFDSLVSEKLHLVHRQSKKMFRLVESAHDFQRLNANKLSPHPKVFIFNNFIKRIADDFEAKAELDNKNFIVGIPDRSIFVNTDESIVEKVINNLLSNAFKYSAPESDIRLNVKQESSMLQISVSDTGFGISSDDLPHIFERFYQSTHPVNEHLSGSGIGLAFSKRLVEMLNGTIEVESALNEGSRFIVRLPIITDKTQLTSDKMKYHEKQKNDYSTTKLAVNKSINPDNNLKKINVYLVEDNAEMRRYIVGVLSEVFTVKYFVNGKECLEAMENEWPDIIVSDVLMPVMDGYSLCKQIKMDVKTSHIPVILLTACTDVQNQIEGINTGADAYIGKPFDMHYLISRIENLYFNREKLRSRYLLDIPLRLNDCEEGAKDAEFLTKLYALMAENIENPDIDLNVFARELCLSRSVFFKKVKVLTNQSPLELYRAYKLKQAAELLAQKKYTVSQVYVMTGFKSRTHFSKLFKDKYKKSPGQYGTT